MGQTEYGIEPGTGARLLLLQASDPVESMRLRATRLKVWPQGRLPAQTALAQSQLLLPFGQHTSAFMPVRD